MVRREVIVLVWIVLLPEKVMRSEIDKFVNTTNVACPLVSACRAKSLRTDRRTLSCKVACTLTTKINGQASLSQCPTWYTLLATPDGGRRRLRAAAVEVGNRVEIQLAVGAAAGVRVNWPLSVCRALTALIPFECVLDVRARGGGGGGGGKQML